MPIRGARPRRVVPAGIADAFEGSAAPQGAMAQLGNLIPEPHARAVVVPRPAMTYLTTLPNGGSTGGWATALEIVGDTVYNMYSSSTFPGKDAPSVLHPSVPSFTPITGLTSALLPVTQPTAGDWIPPTIAQVGGRIVFTHPGFAGGMTLPAAAQQFYGTTAAGSNVMQLGTGVNPHLPQGTVLYCSSLINPGTTVNTRNATSITHSGTGTHGTPTFSVDSAAGVYLGQTVSGLGLQGVVTGISGLNITINTQLGSDIALQPVTFTGNVVTLSAPAASSGTALVTAVSPSSVKFGWLDIGGFSTPLTASTQTPAAAPVITGSFDLTGIEPGMTITGPNIPAGTTVLQAANVSFVVNAQLTSGSQLVAMTQSFHPSMLAVGQIVTGTGILSNATIVALNLSAGTFTLSNEAQITGPSALTVTGSFIVLSNSTTAASPGQTYVVSGGTPAAPLWGAGDLNINPIAGTAPPVFVAGFANRAYFGVNTPTTAGVQASDAGAACVQTFANQTLLFENAVPVTAAAGLPLFNQLGGIIQSLMVFQGDTNINQISGDFSTNDIAVNTLPVATGTLAPNSIAPSPRGLLFAATDGLRLLDFNAAVTDPIGEHGQGLLLPFVNAVTPSRMAGAFNENTYRLTITWQPPPPVQAVWGAVQRTDEFWFHLANLGQPLEASRWTGPHTSRCDLAIPWPAKSSFITAPQADRGKLYRSDPKPAQFSTYTEFGTILTCTYATLLLPDNPDGFAHVATETTIWLGLLSGSQEVLLTATDDFAQQLDQAYIYNSALTGPMQRPILWHAPLVFRQMRISFTVAAMPNVEIGTLVMREKALGYMLPYPVPDAFILGQSVLGGTDATGP